MAAKSKTLTQSDHVRLVMERHPNWAASAIQQHLLSVKHINVSTALIYGIQAQLRKKTAAALRKFIDPKPNTVPAPAFPLEVAEEPVNLAAPVGSSLEGEIWREYQFSDTVYRINDPKRLVVGKTTHRVLDEEGLVHIVPGPGQFGCVIRIKPFTVNDWCQF